MYVSDEPPDYTKSEPGENKTGNEGKENISPLHINHGSEYILFQKFDEYDKR